MKRYIIISLAALVAAVIALSYFILNDHRDTLRQIKKNGKLKVIMVNNANVYYSYRDQYMGFEYDLAKKFADYLDVGLEVITPGWDRIFESLNTGEGDLIAAGLTITEPREAVVSFSNGYMEIQQQVIVHKDNRRIKELSDLEGKKVHVRAGTSYHQRLQELQKDGMDIKIVPVQNIPTEELIRQVAEKEIEITIADSNIALLNRRYYPDIRIALPIEESQELGWGVRKCDDRFVEAINDFFDQSVENGVFGKIYDRYYRNVTVFDYLDLKKFHKRLETRLPKYEAIIRKEAKEHGFDWRMIAAVVYQESHLNPKAKSHTGVRGLMQVTLSTAKEMGITNRLDPEQSVKAGVGYLAKIYDRFDDIKNPETRMLFALASYNIGYGHIRDAQEICRKEGWAPNEWKSLKKALPLLRVEEYYKNTAYGYARGTEPVNYVSRILTYYDIIKRKAHDEV